MHFYFYCTRCGIQLQIEADLAGQSVRCGHCANVVRSSESEDRVPTAAVTAEYVTHPIVSIDPLPVLPLNYAPAWAGHKQHGESLEVLAARLARVEVSARSDDESAMCDCPFCGSTITRYVGRCPFCRHPLHGS